MEEVQSYTDKLRKTYRQSLDVILPFTNHEAVVYCNDDEFENHLKEQHSSKDLQACIYLLERHIDLQQEIIQGLTHLQEIHNAINWSNEEKEEFLSGAVKEYLAKGKELNNKHRYDKLSSDYDDTVEKLVAAQNRLAVLRSRTVRCLTKQIQQRYGDSNIKLPAWSSNAKETTISALDIPLTNGEPTSSRLGSSVTPTTDSTFDKSTGTSQEEELILGDNSFADYNVVQTTHKDSGITDEQQENKNDSFKSETMVSHDVPTKPKEDKISAGDHSKREESLPSPVGNNEIYEEDKVTEQSLGNSKEKHVSKDSFATPSNINGFSHAHELSVKQLSNSHVQTNPHVTCDPCTSSSQVKRPSQKTTRHIVEPIDETITVELLNSGSNGENGGPKQVNVRRGVSNEKLSEQNDSKDSVHVPAPRENLHDHTDSTLDSAPDERVSDNQLKTLEWDPEILIREILGKVKPIKAEQFDGGEIVEEIQMAGYLEKLPVNKKKASLLKNWRKRYFKIVNGKLFYFEDHRASAPISFIRLNGCQVVDTGNKCLEVTERADLGGKLLVIKCATTPEVQDWKKALEGAGKEKVRSQYFELVPEKRSVVIIDLGSSSIKAGFLEDDAWPQVLIPSVYAVHKEDSKNVCYGYEALEPSVRNVSKLVFPLRPPVTVGKYFLDPNDLIGFIEIIFKELQVDPSHYQVVMTTPVNLREQDKDRLVEIMLDYFQVAGIYMKSQAILSMYSYSATCGVVVNIGDSIDVVPIEDGYIVEPGVTSLPFGGRQVTDHFVRTLASSGYRYFSEIENYIGEYLKVKTCYVSQDFAEEVKKDVVNISETVNMSEFSLPSGDKMVTVGKERFIAHEGLFKPELWGKDTPGLTEMIYQAVMACSIDSRKDMCRNIFLSGGTTKVPGFAERLQAELARKFSSSLVVQVHAAPDRQFAAFIGAAVLASLETFDDLCISSEEWEEVGPSVLKKWDNV